MHSPGYRVAIFVTKNLMSDPQLQTARKDGLTNYQKCVASLLESQAPLIAPQTSTFFYNDILGEKSPKFFRNNVSF